MNKEFDHLATKLSEKTLSVDYLKSYLSNLNHLTTKQKGDLFERFVSTLYEGNGYKTKINGGRNDCGADVIIYKDDASTPIKIIQCKNQNRPLSADSILTELRKFENDAASKYRCNQFEIISTNGFVRSKEQFERFNIALNDLNSLERLINGFSEDGDFTPSLTLHGYNEETYRKITAMVPSYNRVAVTQATGTGKRYLAAKIMLENQSKRILFLSPSNHINDQQRDLLPFINCEYKTYQCLTERLKKDGCNNTYDLIIVDEYHRLGAPKWLAAFNVLLNANPNAKLVGFTATPRRHSDQLDMSHLLFHGAVASEISLQDAIARKILPSPVYITALYDIDNIVHDANDLIERSNLDDTERASLKTELRNAKIDWSESRRVEHILAKHLSDVSGKYIIFCEDKEHAYHMIEDVRKWFKRANRINGGAQIKINDQFIHTDLKASEKTEILSNFKKNINPNQVELLFSVNMLNEGLHISGVSRVILLRKTNSPIIHFQQIGRALSVSGGENPFIFDLVNNIESISSKTFKSLVNEAIDSENQRRKEIGLGAIDESIGVTAYDEALDLEQFFESLEQVTSSWNVFYSLLVKFKEIHNHCSPNKYSDDFETRKLGEWLSRQVTDRNKGRLAQSQIDKLDSLGVIWDYNEHEWQQNFKKLCAYKKTHHNCHPSLPNEDPELNLLGSWVRYQIHVYKNGNLLQSRIAKLEELGVVWDRYERAWLQNYQRLVTFQKLNGHCNPNREDKKCKETRRIGEWVNRQIVAYNKGELEHERVAKLEALGMIWSKSERVWLQNYQRLVTFQKLNGHCNPSKDMSESKETRTIGGWVSRQISYYHKGKLSQDRISKLEDLGMIWDISERAWLANYQALVEFTNMNGHCRPSSGSREDVEVSKIGRWVTRQRVLKKKGVLPQEKVRLLDKLGRWM